VNVADVFFMLVWIWNIFKAILRRGRGKRENNRGDEPNWGTSSTHKEMSQLV
jgi:hypothetical protein